MKIGFVGAGGTGKTTLAKLLAEKTGLPLIPSPSRKCFEKHGVKTEDDQARMTLSEKWSLQYDIFEAINESVFSHDKGIFDRTHLDNFCYSIIQCREAISDALYKEMEQVTIKGLKSFNIVYYFPLYNWNIPSDGMRTESYAQRRIHADLVLGFLDNHRLSYPRMWDVPNEERLLSLLQLRALRAFLIDQGKDINGNAI